MGATVTFAQRHSWMIAVLASADLSAGAKVVAIRIALFLNLSDGRCDPSAATIAKAVSMTPRGVEKAIAALAGAGWLGWEAGHGRRSNQYVLRLDRVGASGDNAELSPNYRSVKMATCTEPQFGGDPNGSARFTEQIDEFHRTKMRVVPNHSSDEHIEQDIEQEEQETEQVARCARDGVEPPSTRSLPRSVGSGPDDRETIFATIWQHYPRKQNKPGARAALNRALDDGADRDQILAGVHRYAAERIGEDPKLTLGLMRWLDEHRWEDEPIEPWDGGRDDLRPRDGANDWVAHVRRSCSPEEVDAEFGKPLAHEDGDDA